MVLYLGPIRFLPVPFGYMYWGPAFQEMLFSRMNDIFAKDTQKSLQKRPGIQRKRAAEVTGTIAAGPPIAGGRKRKLKVEPPADAHVAATGTPAASEHSKKTPKGKESPAVGVLSSVNVTNELSIFPAVKVEKTKVEEDESLGGVAEEGSNLVQPQLIAASFETVKPGETITAVPLKKEEAADLIAANAASDASLPLADDTVSDTGSNRLGSALPSVSAEMAVSAGSLEREDLDMTSQPDLSEALQAVLSVTPRGEGPASSDLTKSLRKVRLAKKTTADVPAKLLLTAEKLPPTTDVTDKLSLTASPAKLSSADASPGKLLVAASPAKLGTASLPAKLLPAASPIKLSQAVTPAEQFVPASPGKLTTSDSAANMSKANLSAVQLSAKLPVLTAEKLPTAAEKVDLAAAVSIERQPKLLPVTDKLDSEENSTVETSSSFLPLVNTTAVTGTGITTTTPAMLLTPQDQAGSVVGQPPPIITSVPAGEEIPSTADGPSAAGDPVRSGGGGVRRTTLGTEVFDFTDDEDVDIPLSNIDFDALNSGIITAAAAGGAVVPTAGCTAVVDLPRLSGGGNNSSSVPLQISIPPPSPGNQALEAGLGDLLTPRHKVMTSSGGIHHHPHYVHHRSSPLKNVFDVSPAVLSRGDAMAAVEAVVGGGGNDTPPPPQQHSIHLQVQQQIGGHRRPSGNSVQNMDIMSDDTDTSLGGGRPHGGGGGGGGGSNSIEQQQQQRVKLGKRRRQRRIQDASDGDGDTEDDQLDGGGGANSRSSRDTLLSSGGRPKRAKTADSVAAAASGGPVIHHAPPIAAAAATTRPSSAASGTSTASGGRGGGGVEGEGGGRLPTVEEDDGKQSPDSQRSNEDKSRWKKNWQNFLHALVFDV